MNGEREAWRGRKIVLRPKMNRRRGSVAIPLTYSKSWWNWVVIWNKGFESQNVKAATDNTFNLNF